MEYSALETRIRTLSKHPYGSPEHRKLVLALAECYDLILPFWTRPSPTLASCSRHAKRFGNDAGFNYGLLKQLRTRVFGVQQGIDYKADRIAYYVAGAAFDVLHAVTVTAQAYSTYQSISSTYVWARGKDVKVEETTDEVTSMVDAMRAQWRLADEFEVLATAIFDRHFGVQVEATVA